MENNVEYNRYKPAVELQNFVNCYWFYCVGPNDHEFNILPDAFFDVIIFLKEQNRTIITGVWTKSSALRFSNASVIGVQFKPQFLCIKDFKIADCVDSFKDFNLQDLNINMGKLAGLVDSREAVIDYFNAVLTEMIHNQEPDNKAIQMFDIFEHNIGEMGIYDLAKKMNCSQKSIFRSIKKYLGISPKGYFSIMRFRESLKKKVNTSTGFYDQSHFIKNVKKLTGQTPKEILTDTVRNLQYKDGVDR